MKARKSLAALMMFVALAIPGSAFAADSSVGAYNDSNQVAGLQEGGGSDDGGSSPTTTDDGGSLPFTGADLGVLAAAGGFLLLLGFGLRRMTHGPSHA